MKLEYINDRKGKSQSHEIRMIDEDIDDMLNMFLDGYGEDLLEALNEYTKNILSLKTKLDKHVTELLSGDIEFIDGINNKVTEEIIDDYYTGDSTRNDITNILEVFKKEHNL